MSALLGWAFVAVLALLLTVWIGPHILCWLLNRAIDRYNRRLIKFQADRAKRHEEIRTALDALKRYQDEK